MANTNPLGVLLSATNVASTIVQRDGSGNFAAGTITAALAGNASTATTLTTTLPVNLGGTGQTSYTDGQLLIGNTTGNTLDKASLTAGTGISITPGSGSITIASTNAIDSNGASVNNGIGTTSATLVNSQSIRIGNMGTLTARIAFTATAASCDLLITPPFGTTFTAGGQASGTGIVNKSSGAAIGDGTVSIIDSLAANGVKVDMVLATGSGSYTLYVSLQYTISN